MSFNKSLDHLNPINWFPYYHMETDRRAVPAHTLSIMIEEPRPYIYLGQDTEAMNLDAWRLGTGLDLDLNTMDIIVEHGRTGELRYAPERFLYLSEKDFKQYAPVILGHLKETYDYCWERYQKTTKRRPADREAFDAIAESLRNYRRHLEQLIEEYKNEQA